MEASTPAAAFLSKGRNGGVRGRSQRLRVTLAFVNEQHCQPVVPLVVPGRSEREVTSLSRRTRAGFGSTSRCVAAGTPTGFGTGDDVVLIDLGRRHVGSIVLR
jgi:hypothetical protein